MPSPWARLSSCALLPRNYPACYTEYLLLKNSTLMHIRVQAANQKVMRPPGAAGKLRGEGRVRNDDNPINVTSISNPTEKWLITWGVFTRFARTTITLHSPLTVTHLEWEHIKSPKKDNTMSDELLWHIANSVYSNSAQIEKMALVVR